jgi:adenylylsulfate kinase
MATPPTENQFWNPSAVTPEDRERLLHQKGCVLWFTGLSGSGKSTIAQAVERALIDRGHLAYILDGDNIRHGLNAGLGFTVADRNENLRRISEVSRLFAHSGVICLTAFISPLRENRAQARTIIGPDRFLEIHVATDLAECERRDTKGLYEKARSGDIPNFTGISSPYEPPENPDIRIHTQDRTVADCAAQVVQTLGDRGVLI